VAVVCMLCIVVVALNTTKNGTSSNVTASAVKPRYCALGLVGECPANEKCVVRRRPTMLRSRSGLCRCVLGYVRHPDTGLCVNGTQ